MSSKSGDDPPENYYASRPRAMNYSPHSESSIMVATAAMRSAGIIGYT